MRGNLCPLLLCKMSPNFIILSELFSNLISSKQAVNSDTISLIRKLMRGQNQLISTCFSHPINSRGNGRTGYW